jgi:hypothetical protein
LNFLFKLEAVDHAVGWFLHTLAACRTGSFSNEFKADSKIINQCCTSRFTGQIIYFLSRGSSYVVFAAPLLCTRAAAPQSKAPRLAVDLMAAGSLMIFSTRDGEGPASSRRDFL